MAETIAAARGWEIDEAARSALIADYELETLRGSAALTRITDFAAALCEAPVALVNVVDTERQHFIARSGYDAPEGPPETSFCAVAMHSGDVMIVRDATRDPRFADNPQVTGPPSIRFYAGVTLRTENGVPLGSLCVIDTDPHPQGLSDLQLQGLQTLADSVMALLRDSRDSAAWRHAEKDARRALGESENRFRTLADTMPQMVWSSLPDGYVDYYNARWHEFTGTQHGSDLGEGWGAIVHADDQEHTFTAWERSLSTGEPYQIEYRLRHADGTYRWVLGRAVPLRDEERRITRWFGTGTDIHAQKLVQEEREVISQELSHRIKNIFSVIAGLITFAARGHPEFADTAADLRRRITALGRAHDFVRPHSAQSQPSLQQNSLKGLLIELFAPYQIDGSDRLIVAGDDQAIDDRSATPLALMFHELATNATKYGALSTAGGQVRIDLHHDAENTVMVWEESGGPAVAAPPEIEGFGSRLIELSGARQLGGRVARDWLPGGLRVTLTAPTAAFSRRRAD